MTRALGRGRSRRGILKGLGAAALGAVGLSLTGAAEAAKGGASNAACAKFCAATFGDNTAGAEACTADAAHSTGLCNQCGPAAAAGTGLTLCGQACVDESSDPTNCGGCGTVCASGCHSGACCMATDISGCTANSECCSGICQQGTCYATVAGACAPTANFCTSPTPCGTYPGCVCYQTVAGDAFCGQTGHVCVASCDECAGSAGATCVQGGGENCSGCPYFCAVPCRPA